MFSPFKISCSCYMLVKSELRYCIDIRGKELDRQVGVSIVVTSGSLCGVMIEHEPEMPEMWV